MTIPADHECLTCPEIPVDELTADDCCVNSKRQCGHHCNCVWIHDCCHWCGGEFGEDGESWHVPIELPSKELTHA